MHVFTPKIPMKAVMRTLSTILVITSFALSLSASPKCERLELYDFSNLRQSFERDLLSSIWRSSLLGTTSTLYFQEDGVVIAVPVNQERVQTYLWSLSVMEDQAILSLVSSEMERTFFIAPTCNGISALSGGKLSLLTAMEANFISEANRNFMRTQLTGFWICQVRKSKKLPAGDFSLALHQDGSFEVSAGPDSFHTSHKGFWQLSPDGQYLILHTRVLIDSSEHFVAEYVNLKSVDFEDMVIGAQVLPRVLSTYCGNNLLYLEKVKASS